MTKGEWRSSPDGQCKDRKCKCKCHKDNGYEYTGVPYADGAVCPWCREDTWIEQEDVGSETMELIIVLRCQHCGCRFEPTDKAGECHEEGDEDMKDIESKPHTHDDDEISPLCNLDANNAKLYAEKSK